MYSRYSKNKILLKSLFTLIIAIVMVCFTSKASASSYTTLQSGAWNASTTWTPTATSIGTVGTGDGQFEYTYGPSDVAVDSSGNIYAPATNPARIQKFDSNGNFLLKWGSTGAADGQLNAPTGITIDIDGNVWIYDYGNYRISKFSPTGSFLLAFGWGVSTGANSFEVCTSSCQIGISGFGNGQFKNLNSGRSIVASPDGYIYTGDGDGNVVSWVQKFDLNGNFISKWSIGDNSSDGGIRDMATDSGNNIYVMQSASISKYNASGTILLRIGWGVLDGSNEFQSCTSSCYGGLGGTGEGQFSSSSGGISVGSNGDIYTDANQPTYFIQKFDSNGNYLFRIPVLFRDGYGSAIDSQDRLYVAAAEPNPQSPDLIYRYDFSQTPSVIDAVTITTGKTVTIPTNTTVYAKRIVIDSGGTLTLGTNSNVIYYNSFVNNGTLNQDSETQIKQALIPVLSGSSPTTDHTPTFDMVCKTGATVSLIEGSNTVASGTCADNTISLTSSNLTDGSYSFYARETDGDGTRTGTQGASNIIDDTVGDYLLGGMGLALGSDSFARIAYGSYRDDNPISYARCTDADCTNPIITEVVSDTGGGGRVPGSNIMTLGSDGFARIVSSDSDGFLQMIRCLDQDCITKTIILVDENSDNDPGYYGTSIHMGNDGYPRIMYENCDNNNYDVHYVRFSDDETIAVNTNLTTQSGVAPECSPYDEATMAVGQDGFSRYIYMDGAGDDELKLARCTDNDCTDPVISIIDPDGSKSAGYNASSIKIGSDGFVRVAYVNYDNTFSFALCNDADCSIPIITELPVTDGDTTNGMGFDLNSQNLASMTYQDIDGAGHLITCNNQSCSDYNDFIVDSQDGAFYGSASLIIDENDIPHIAYGAETDDSLHYWSPSTITIYTEIPTPTHSTRSGSRGYVSLLSTRPTPVTFPLITPMNVGCPQGFTCTPLLSSTPAPYNIPPKGTFKRDLQKGSTGPDVRALQTYLNSHGYPLPSTGYFGPLTKEALQKFQKKNNLPVTGYFGPKTRGVMK